MQTDVIESEILQILSAESLSLRFSDKCTKFIYDYGFDSLVQIQDGGHFYDKIGLIP